MVSDFYKILKQKIHTLISDVYNETEKFPNNEMYGTVSQLCRSAVSIMLNFVEGHARIKLKVKVIFFEIFYGSLKET